MKVDRRKLLKSLRKTRKEMSKLSREERDNLFCRGMRIIYGEKN
jgi:hypothetical protein